MQPNVIDPTTTIRRYSIVVEADERRQAALVEWKAASEAMLATRNTFTEARLHAATEALKQANKDYYSVTRKVFPAQDETAQLMEALTLSGAFNFEQ